MPAKRLIIILITFLLNIVIISGIWKNNYSTALPLLWLLNIALLLILSTSYNFEKPTKVKLSLSGFLTLLIIFLPVFIRVFSYQPDRIHQDDLITAFFSAKEDFTNINFFSGIPSEKTQWVAQFPTIFFIIQKGIFRILGESLLSIKISVLPYVFLVSFTVYEITKTIFNRKTAAIAVFLYSFFPPALYLETLGLHFIGSTAMYCLFIHSLILYLKSNNVSYYILAGIFCAFSYLFYITSYIAFPILIILILLSLFRKNRITTLKHSSFCIFSFFIVLSPFLIYTLKFDNYFFQRSSQVSLIGGSWSDIKTSNIHESFKPLNKNLTESIQSLYKDGPGGHGGYTYNHLALFGRTNLFLLGAGLIFTILKKGKRKEVLILILTIGFSFSAMFLSIPPPAFHRFSLSFPFLMIISSGLFYPVTLTKVKTGFFVSGLITFNLLLFSHLDLLYYLKATEKELEHEYIKFSKIINGFSNKEHLHIASYPGFAFEKIFYFTAKNNLKSTDTNYHNYFLDNFNKDENYLYFVIFDKDFIPLFKKADYKGKALELGDSISLFYN